MRGLMARPTYLKMNPIDKALKTILDFYHLIEEQFNIEIKTIFNSQCVFLLFGKTSNLMQNSPLLRSYSSYP